MKFVFLDHVYPDAWASLPHGTMQEWFQQCFGTADFWEQALTGHEACTKVLNWYPSMDAMLNEAMQFGPDVVVSMEVGRFKSAQLRSRFPKQKLVAFCSHRAGIDDLRGWDALFSSFPWMKHGPEVCHYLPLAFGRPVPYRCGLDHIERDIPVSFVGGLGAPIWTKATDIFAKIAEAIPEFKWWGYACGNRLEQLPTSLRSCYQGPAWGRDMYRIYMRSRTVLNRHGEIAQGWGNNCRQYEVTGCGAFLLTDAKGEFETAVTYRDADDAIEQIRSNIKAPTVTDAWATGMCRYCLEDHCYENRVPKFLHVIESL